jgi:DNA-binding NarL/FixJ family response regulator
MATASADIEAVRMHQAGPRAPVGAVVFFATAPEHTILEALERAGLRRSTDVSKTDAIVVLLDRATALAATEELHAEGSVAPVVAILEDEAAADAALVRQLVAHGVRAVVARSQVPTALGASIDAIRAGQVVFPAAAVASVRPVFTVREKQVLGMVVLGFSNAEISQKLFVAESTVKSHLATAFAKLGVRSRRAAAEAILDPINGLGTGILTISERA